MARRARGAREWVCPRCQQENEPGERFCYFCKYDRGSVASLYVELVAG